MDKIYRRSTQLCGTPKKKKNEKNRIRNTIMNFRVSPKEKELIDARIRLTGLSRSEFFIESCLYQAILVKGNIKSLHEIKDTMKVIVSRLDAGNQIENLEPELLESLRIILEIIDRVFGKK
jgi:uncharacterized protein (DUF1778 family)